MKDEFDSEPEEVRASRGNPLDVLGYLPRAINKGLADLKVIAETTTGIAESTTALPDLLREVTGVRQELEAIRVKVSSMDDEVIGMHAAVEEMKANLAELDDTLHPLRRRGRKRRPAELATEE